MAALRVLRQVQADGGRPTAGQMKVLGRWSGWGAVPKIFAEGDERFAEERDELRGLLSEAEWRAAARTTLNAHYTDAALAQVVWDALDGQLEHAGIDRVAVLEPGCGAGTFLGLAPAGRVARIIGVELDPTTAAIAQALYPHADIRAESFADTRLAGGRVDLVVGNVPFGKTQLYDPVHNSAGHSLHNYFLLKSLALTRPGGVVAVLTSHWTMDATNPAARRQIAQSADLFAAVRLPISAHWAAAGTQVVTDLLLLQRRDPADGPGDGSAWEATDLLPGTDKPVPVNRWFTTHPDMVIGETGLRSGPFGPELDVTADPGVDVAAGLAERIDTALEAAADGDPGWALFGPDTGPQQALRVLAPDAPAHSLEDHLAVEGAGFTVVRDQTLVEHPVPSTQARELHALLGLRDATVALLAAEAANAEDTETITGLRRSLGVSYDTYARTFGPINRVTLRRTGRVDPDTGEERMARISPPQGGFRIDPHSPAVYALEEYDATTGIAAKAPILLGRVIAPRTVRFGADTPADAVAICLDTHGRVDLAEVARLLGQTEDATRPQLTGLVFTEPPTNPDGTAGTEQSPLVPAPEYLSGNVRVKLAAARAAAERDGDGRWDTNISALQAVIPVDLTPAEIDARLGASWISAAVVQQFLREILNDPKVVVENPGGSTWAVRGGRWGVLALSVFGTSRISAGELAHRMLEQRSINVVDEDPEGRKTVNLTETVAAQEKAEAISERFTDWLWADLERATTLAATYNEMFNAIVLRSYDGAQMALPGLTVSFTPREHQVAAVARIVSEPAVLLAHEVGAGKTAEMVIGAMELRRLGMVNKPAVVVPNHMLEQFTREWMQLYPRARVLAASVDDLGKDRRRRLIARVATGDWDAVILSRSAFERIPLSPQGQHAYLDSQLDEMRQQLANAKGGAGLTVKRLEGALSRAEERLKKLLDGEKDPGIIFEETGIDYLFIDEAHGYKNLRTVSNIPNVGIEGSNRASDLDMKLGYARGRHGTRVATFATATPIANSVAEAYTMQRFLRPDLLTAAGLTDFDTWAATFGEVTTDLELSPSGTGFTMKSRFAKFRNVPELLRMWHVSADVKTAEDLNLPTPALRGGKPDTVVVEASPQLTAFMRGLAERAEKVQSRAVPPEEDNMLLISSHGRAAALDLRLLNLKPGAETLLTAAADRIARIHHDASSLAYPDSDMPGALQIVFCDLGTPKTGADAHRWSAYTELRALLVDRGLPAEAVRFVHEARNDKEKGELFAAARNGRISVLIGSTEKMGVGTNVQKRAIALHHLDCPWRPADLAQRDGRAMRQGNLNPEIEIVRYVTEGSFAAYLWQTVERKARFIGQVMRGRLDVREIEDIGDTALSYSEVKALATGDARIMEKAKLDADLTRLDRLERAHTRNTRLLQQTVTSAKETLPGLQAERAALLHAVTLTLPTSGDQFAMTVNGRRYSERVDAAVALRDALGAVPPALEGYNGRTVRIGEIAGFSVTATNRRPYNQDPYLRLELSGLPRAEARVSHAELRADRPLGIITRLENQGASAAAHLAAADRDIAKIQDEADLASAGLTKPFPHADTLRQLRVRSRALDDELAATPEQPAAGTGPATRGLGGFPPSGLGLGAGPVTVAGSSSPPSVTSRSQWSTPMPDEPIHDPNRPPEHWGTAAELREAFGEEDARGPDRAAESRDAPAEATMRRYVSEYDHVAVTVRERVSMDAGTPQTEGLADALAGFAPKQDGFVAVVKVNGTSAVQSSVHDLLERDPTLGYAQENPRPGEQIYGIVRVQDAQGPMIAVYGQAGTLLAAVDEAVDLATPLDDGDHTVVTHTFEAASEPTFVRDLTVGERFRSEAGPNTIRVLDIGDPSLARPGCVLLRIEPLDGGDPGPWTNLPADMPVERVTTSPQPSDVDTNTVPRGLQAQWNDDFTYEVSPHDYDWDSDDLEAAERERDTALEASVLRWGHLVDRLDPEMTEDLHWPTLAAHLDRIDALGVDVPTVINQVTTDQPLPEKGAARALGFRLHQAVPKSVLPHTPTEADTQLPAGTPPPADSAPEMPVPRSGPCR